MYFQRYTLASYHDPLDPALQLSAATMHHALGNALRASSMYDYCRGSLGMAGNPVLEANRAQLRKQFQ